jgi:hypothetical protein
MSKAAETISFVKRTIAIAPECYVITFLADRPRQRNDVYASTSRSADRENGERVFGDMVNG